MKSILDNIDSDGILDPLMFEEIELNIEDAKKQIDEEIVSISGFNADKSISRLIELYNDFAEENHFALYIINSLYEFYLQNIDDMIKGEQYYSIDALIDLFSNNAVFSKNENEKKELFVKKTYKILLINEDLTSFIAIASFRFINLLSISFTSNSTEYLKKYLKEEENKIYSQEVKKALNKV